MVAESRFRRWSFTKLLIIKTLVYTAIIFVVAVGLSNGDVVNTASRIQNECKTYQRNCLVSGALKNRLHPENGYQWERIKSVALRGKETEVELYSVVDSH